MAPGEEPNAEEAKRNQVLELSGLVVEFDLPSKAALEDWLRREEGGLRLREVVELYPREIFKELEAIRRYFYLKLGEITVPCYSLRLLPMSNVEALRQLVERTRRELEELDRKIEGAVEDAYTRRAVEYFMAKGKRPRLGPQLASRFSVSLMPLRISRSAWEELLDSQLREELARMEEEARRRREALEGKVKEVEWELRNSEERLRQLEERERQLKAQLEEMLEAPMAEERLKELQRQRRDLEAEVEYLESQRKELSWQVERLNRELEARRSSMVQAAGWAREAARQTAEKVSFDAAKLMIGELRSLAEEAVKAIEEEDPRSLKRVERQLNALIQSASSMGLQRIASAAERVLADVRARDLRELKEILGRLRG